MTDKPSDINNCNIPLNPKTLVKKNLINTWPGVDTRQPIYHEVGDFISKKLTIEGYEIDQLSTESKRLLTIRFNTDTNFMIEDGCYQSCNKFYCVEDSTPNKIIIPYATCIVNLMKNKDLLLCMVPLNNTISHDLILFQTSSKIESKKYHRFKIVKIFKNVSSNVDELLDISCFDLKEWNDECDGKMHKNFRIAMLARFSNGNKQTFFIDKQYLPELGKFKYDITIDTK